MHKSKVQRIPLSNIIALEMAHTKAHKQTNMNTENKMEQPLAQQPKGTTKHPSTFGEMPPAQPLSLVEQISVQLLTFLQKNL